MYTIKFDETVTIIIEEKSQNIPLAINKRERVRSQKQLILKVCFSSGLTVDCFIV